VQDYWKHATSCSSCKDPDSGDTFSWAVLAAFEPIDLRVKDGDASLTNEDLLKKAEEEIVKRIQSRFHRGDHINFILQQSYSHWRKAALFDSLQSDINNLEDLKREALALFESIDLNKDRIISKDELLKAFPHLDEKTADLLIKEIDTDEDGAINFDELWTMIESLAAASAREQDLKISRSSKSSKEVERGSCSPGDS
jgi:hypothetical protein